MNATSTLVLILVLSFAAERLVKGVLFLLGFAPWWRRRFPDPLSFPDSLSRARAHQRMQIVSTIMIALVTGAAVWQFEDLHILRLLVGDGANRWIDMGVSLLVVMGGSEMIGKLVAISGLGEDLGGARAGMTSTAAGAPGSDPIEITGRLVLESDLNHAPAPPAPVPAPSQTVTAPAE